MKSETDQEAAANAKSGLKRRKFIGAAAASAAFTVVPGHLLGGQNFIPPSDKIAVGYLGLGIRGSIELMGMLPLDDFQVVAVCDPVKDSDEYVELGRHGGIANSIGNFMGKSNYRSGARGAPGGRDVGKEIAEAYYAHKTGTGQYKCAAYADFREMLAKEDIDAVKIMTPDHLHATIAIAAMKIGKHVCVHKPIANRLNEAKLVFETARQTKVATHFMPYGRGPGMGTDVALEWIKAGAIGTLREIHNWTNRPVWPQYQEVPSDRPPIPRDFDWQLWLGPSVDRPYHPHYTHTVFRGWYEFGGGSIADMGHYSLWPVFAGLNLPAPRKVEATASRYYELRDLVCARITGESSYPLASSVRFKIPAHDNLPEIDLYWYDGGMKPPTPRALDEDNREMPESGLMFVGDKGIILDARLIPEGKMQAFAASSAAPPSARERAAAPAGRDSSGRGGPAPTGGAIPGRREQVAGRDGGQGRTRARPWTNPLGVNGYGGISDMGQWITAIRGGKPSEGNFLNAIAITEAVNLASVAWRSGESLSYDSHTWSVTNASQQVRKYLTREYRKGWEL